MQTWRPEREDVLGVDGVAWPETDPRISRSGVLAGLVAAIAGLGVSWSTIEPVAPAEGVEPLVSAVAWWCAALLVTWLALSLATWCLVIGRTHDAHGGPRWLRALTIPGSRSLAEGLMAVSLVVVPSACSVGASQVDAPRLEVLRPAESTHGIGPSSTIADTATLPSIRPPTTLVDTATLGETTPTESSTTIDSTPPSIVTPESDIPRPSEPVMPTESLSVVDEDEVADEDPADEETASIHVVRSGEHLWSIAATRVEHVTGQSPTDVEIAQYWVRLIEANRGQLSSGDPNLIFPGEELSLP